MVLFNAKGDLDTYQKSAFRTVHPLIQTSMTASAAGSTCGAAVILQGEGNFLSGLYNRSRAGGLSAKKYVEECYARATVTFILYNAHLAAPHAWYPWPLASSWSL